MLILIALLILASVAGVVSLIARRSSWWIFVEIVMSLLLPAFTLRRGAYRRSGERQATAVAANVLDRCFDAPLPTVDRLPDSRMSGPRRVDLCGSCRLFFLSARGRLVPSGAMTAQLFTDGLVIAIWQQGQA
jgi:hypothetical protein